MTSRRELRHDHPRAEPQKSCHTILEQQIAQAEVELPRPARARLLASLAALEIAHAVCRSPG